MSTPTGTRDLNNNEVALRNQIFNIATTILKKRNAHQIDTPVIELLSTVNTLYGGEFDKLVYKLSDKDKEKDNNLLLRYDLTVPFARYVGEHGLQKFKRFQYGKVYRRDTPQIGRGRYREFYQLDYDIAGDDNGSNINDYEMLETLSELLDTIIGKNTYTVKLNHKDIVIKMLSDLHIEESKFSDVFCALDKLDKRTFDEIEDELKLSISEHQCLMLKQLYESNNIENEYIKEIMTFLQCLNITNYIFDPFLIRGMDYYTGIIYEVTYNDKDVMPSTISAGGRYDNMIEIFSNKGKIPAIGLSLGIDRIVKILKFDNSDETPQIFVASTGDNMSVERAILSAELRRYGYSVVTADTETSKLKRQLTDVLQKYSDNIPVMIIIGENELETNTITIKNMKTREQFIINRCEEDIKSIVSNIMN